MVPLRGHRRIVVLSSWLQCAASYTQIKLSPYSSRTEPVELFADSFPAHEADWSREAHRSVS